MFKCIGLFAKPGDPRVAKALFPLLKILRDRHAEVAIDDTCVGILGDHDYATITPQSRSQFDLIIVIGGDGTLLRAAHMFLDGNARLLGINLGQLGFLTDILPDDLEQRVPEILDGHYLEEARATLSSKVMRDGQVLAQHHAINDVILQKWNSARLIQFDTTINQHFIHSQRSDGVIVSTPTGSTAYALSGGGPILYPSLDALLLVPICPHTLSNRPLVVEGNSRIEITVGSRELDHARLTCDGEIKFELAPLDTVVVEKAERRVHLIHPAAHDHYATLRAKLNWG